MKAPSKEIYNKSMTCDILLMVNMKLKITIFALCSVIVDP